MLASNPPNCKGRDTQLPGNARAACLPCGVDFFAVGTVRGSASYTPSTPEWVPFNNASASISAARNAAAVSVVKNGLPVPAAKMTTRPFSRWRMARRRM